MKNFLFLLLLSIDYFAYSESLFIVSGETSGDRLGKWYIQTHEKNYDAVHATGGTFLQQAGATLFLSLNDIEKHNLRLLNFNHPFELFSKIKKTYELVTLLTHEILSKNISEVVLIDFPFVNIPLAWNLKRKKPSLHITYLAPPALWVHGSWGVHYILKKYCDRVVVLYPFEPEWYAQHCNLFVEYGGYPFLNDYHTSSSREANSCIALFPGSRKKEVEVTLPLFSEVIKYFKNHYPEVTFIVSQAPGFTKNYLLEQCEKAGIDPTSINILETHAEKNSLSSCCLAITKPGTTTLELALLGIPHIITYKVPWWMYYLFKYTFSVPYVGLSNLLAHTELCPELLQHECTPEKLIATTENLYKVFKEDKNKYCHLCNDLSSLQTLLQPVPMKNTKPTIIFDFDGTIADTYALLIDVLQHEAPKYGIKPCSAEECERFRSMHMKEVLKELGIPFYKIPSFVVQMHNYVKNHKHEVKPHHGMRDLFLLLHKEHYRIGIVTSNNVENVREFLEEHTFPPVDFIHSDHSLFGKATVLQRAIKEYHLNPLTTWYVGDEVRDIEAAQKCSIKSIAVSWGYNSKSLLETTNPTWVIDTPDQLPTLVQ